MTLQTGSAEPHRSMPVRPLDSDGDDCPICRQTHRGMVPNAARRILVAEDDPAIANLIAYNLEQDGYRLSIVSDGAAALASLRDSPPDLLILDLLLPLQSGWQVLRSIRSRRDPTLAALPVLVVSALACDRLEHELARCGAQHVLGKPFSVKELRDTVRALLEGNFTKLPSTAHPHAMVVG